MVSQHTGLSWKSFPGVTVRGIQTANALALCFCIFVSAPASAQDAKSIVQKMAAVYKKANSYSAKANVDRRDVLPNGKIVSNESLSSLFICKRPNKLQIQFIIPSGTRIISCDGNTLSLVLKQPNVYVKEPVKVASLAELLPKLARFDVIADMDALYFLSGGDIHPDLTGFTMKPDSTRQNRPVYVVTAYQPPRKGRGSSGSSVRFTWMIFKDTFLLAHLEAEVSNVQRGVLAYENKKRVTRKIMVNVKFIQNIIDPQIDAPIDDKQFALVIPSGAREVKRPAKPGSNSGNKDR